MRRYLTIGEKNEMLVAQAYGCALCGKSLIATFVEYDHSTPVALGNDSKPDQAICKPCHARKTKNDVRAIVKCKRLHRSWFGEKKPKRKTIQSRGFDRRWRKRMDGTVIPREATP